jgi:CoA binding domain
VDVVRPAEEAPQIAREAIKAGAKVLWLQLGIESEEARQVAEAAGLTVVMNRCMGRPTASSGATLHTWLVLAHCRRTRSSQKSSSAASPSTSTRSLSAGSRR